MVSFFALIIKKSKKKIAATITLGILDKAMASALKGMSQMSLRSPKRELHPLRNSGMNDMARDSPRANLIKILVKKYPEVINSMVHK